MLKTSFEIPGPLLIEPKIIADERGYFMESFKDQWFRENVADVNFVQDNQSRSTQAGTIRGLHYQLAPYEQGKLVRCLKGSLFDVAVDIRPRSLTFGRWVGTTLTAKRGEQMWVPVGFAHGFCTLEPDTEVFYKVTSPYSRDHDKGIAFDDPDISVAWPWDVTEAILSEKDKAQPPLASLSQARA